ncbi:unnamed protein product [Thlaspi arvense]|uniref:Uncharacterized protein n=1 Tax=Thlaspi arvense TaxID=13288 RepID=A0AAU9S2H6_THLAR|nr:unnamed protein product [Thlaspi arvense]
MEGDELMLDLFVDSFWYGENTQGLTDHLLIAVQVPPTSLLQVGNGARGIFDREAVHVGGFYQDDVEEDAVLGRCIEARLQFHLHGPPAIGYNFGSPSLANQPL